MKRAVFLLLPALVLLFACGEEVQPKGVYHAQGSAAAVSLELREGGKGIWVTEEEEVAFNWEVRDQELWLHTPAGGLIVGRFTPQGTLRIDLPGVGLLLFAHHGSDPDAPR